MFSPETRRRGRRKYLHTKVQRSEGVLTKGIGSNFKGGRVGRAGIPTTVFDIYIIALFKRLSNMAAWPRPRRHSHGRVKICQWNLTREIPTIPAGIYFRGVSEFNTVTAVLNTLTAVRPSVYNIINGERMRAQRHRASCLKDILYQRQMCCSG